MSDDFEDLLKRWLRDRAGNDRSAIRALAGNVAALPPRRRRGLSPLASAAAILVALALGAFILAPRFGSVGGSAGGTPTNGEAATWNLELARCDASLATALAVFPMEHARDYRLHLPAMLLSPELEVDDPAFVVVYGEMHPFGVGGAPPPPGQTRAPRSLDPGHHDLCVLVGADAATAELNIYGNVDTTGMRAAVESTEPSVSSAPSTEPAADASTPLGFEITIWSGPAGSAVPTTRIREVADCYGGRQLTVDGRLYVWDPTGGASGAYDPATLEGTFSTTAFVPSSATLTAFREGARQLYLAPDGSAVYVETPDTVQRWPHVIGDEVVRTDCN
jgi:hypothetical protein